MQFLAKQTRKVDDKLIKLFNQKFLKKSGKVISIDIPTGLCPDNGELFRKRKGRLYVGHWSL